MISVGYVNNNPPLILCTDQGIKLESFLDTCNEEVNALFSHYCEAYEDYLASEKLFKESGLDGKLESTFIALEAEKESFVKKLGDAIINTTKKVIEYISGIIDKLKNISFKKKSDLQKLDMLCKEHPDLKDKIMKAFDDGSLSLPDMKSFKEMDAAFEEILTLAKKKDIKPGSLQEKVEKMKEKLDNIDKVKVVKVAGATATILGAITAAVKLNDMLKKNAETGTSKLEDTIQQMKNAGGEYYNENMSKIHVLYNAHNWRLGKYRKAAGQTDNVIDRMMNAVMKFTDATKDDFDSNGGKGNSKAKKINNFHDNVKRAEEIKKKLSESEMKKSVVNDLEKKLFEQQTINGNSRYDSLKKPEPKPRTPKPNNNQKPFNNGGGKGKGGKGKKH